MIQKSLDFLSTTRFYDQGFHTWYLPDKSRWEQPRANPEVLSQGQAMLNFARAVRIGRSSGKDTRKWEEFLRRASDFHGARLLASDWEPKSTNEAFFIAPLAQASTLLNETKYLQAAVRAAKVYSSRHLTMAEPYWGGRWMQAAKTKKERGRHSRVSLLCMK